MIAEIPVPELAVSSESVLVTAAEIVAGAVAQMLALPPAAALVDSTERTQLGRRVARYPSLMEQELNQETELASKALIAAELATVDIVGTIEFVIDWLAMAGTETEE